MFVKSAAHLGAILAHWQEQWRQARETPYLVMDCETVPDPDYGKGAALLIGHALTAAWALCYKGEAYVLPTSYMIPSGLSVNCWDAFLRTICGNSSVVKVFHNANYDITILQHQHGVRKPIRPLWDTMIGAWAAAPYMEKSLKARGIVLGHQQRATKTVDFSNPEELAAYAEQDVIITEELYCTQRYGKIKRRARLVKITPSGSKEVTDNPVCKVPLVPCPEQTLSPFMQHWVNLLELLYLEVVLYEAQWYGIGFDVPKLQAIREQALVDYEQRYKATLVTLPKGVVIDNLFSSQQVGNYLYTVFGDTLPKTPKGNIKVDAKTLVELSETGSSFAKSLLALKALRKLLDVYIGMEPANWLCPAKTPKSGLEFYAVPLSRVFSRQNTVGAVTGRTSASKPNLQQIPARKDVYGIRQCFCSVPIPPYISRLSQAIHRKCPKKVLLVLDHAQLELRVMALMSRDKEMVRVLSTRSGDLHAVTAARLNVDRVQAKQLNFLLQYGGNEHALAAQLRFSGFLATEEQVVAWRRGYNVTYPGVEIYRNWLVNTHLRRGYIRMFTGRRRQLPDIDPNNRWSLHKAETTLSNNAIQGSGQDFLKAAVVRCSSKVLNPDAAILATMSVLPAEHRLVLSDYKTMLVRYRRIFRKAQLLFVMQVHDEGIWSVDKHAAEEVGHLVARVMAWRHYFPGMYPYSVPLIVEGGYAQNWAAAKKGNIVEGYDEWTRYQS